MYVVIDSKTYTKIKDISFVPQTDVCGDTVQINEFTLKIITADNIDYGQYAELYNDINVRFAKYWIVYAERIKDGVVQIVARSDIALLDNVMLPAIMYSSEPIKNVLDALMVRQAGAGLVATIEYALSNSLESITITGFARSKRRASACNGCALWPMHTCGHFSTRKSESHRSTTLKRWCQSKKHTSVRL